MMIMSGLIPKGVWNHIETREKLRNKNRQTPVADERPLSQQASSPPASRLPTPERRGRLGQFIARLFGR
ncbi:MAG: hypothetical protein EA415_03995 [Sphaerobacteraceae bacterium]|nr:MAG: hypothetical protein EA415_03995 [Sphaerobacteraceae bacterium]